MLTFSKHFHLFSKPGIQSQALPIFQGMSVTAEKRDAQEAKIPQNVENNQTLSCTHPLNMEGNDSQKLQCNIKNGKKKTNFQQKMNPIQRNQKSHKEFASMTCFTHRLFLECIKRFRKLIVLFFWSQNLIY